MERGKYIKEAKRIVVKVGSSILTTTTGKLDDTKISGLVEQLAIASNKGYEVILVTSGSIAAGIEALGFKTIPKAIPELQAAASVGQGLLIHRYAELFKSKGLNVGQVLVTRTDTTHRQQYLNVKNTLGKLIELNVIPIINENDSTAIDEIKFGDNDTLAALISNIVEADLLIILSDVDGLFTSDPKTKEAELVKKVDDITEEIEKIAGGSGTAFGKGGMETKVAAAKIATAGQTGVVIANGHSEIVLSQILEGQLVGTFFVPKKKKISARKLWILNQPAKGTIYIDEGASRALANGKSLLPAGVQRAQENFDIGDVVSIKVKGQENAQVIKGISNFSSEEIELIAGKKYSEIKNLLDSEPCEEVIHRDDMVVL